jgi:WG containing repeat
VLPIQYGQIEMVANGLLKVSLEPNRGNGQYALFSRTGQALTPFEFKWLGLETAPADRLRYQRLVIASKNERYGYMDPQGRLAIPLQFEFASTFEDGFAQVSKRFMQGEQAIYKVGFINEQGQQVTPFLFDEVKPFKGGLAIVKIGEKYGYINKKLFRRFLMEPQISLKI